MTDLSQREFKRICIVKPSSLGDIIHALPVLNGLRQRYPRARISWIVNTEYLSLLQDHPQLDEVIPFDRQKFKSFWGTVHMTFRLHGFANQLRSREFDLVLDLQGLFRSGLMTFASGAAVRLGFDPAREGAGMFYNHRIPVPSQPMHAVDKNYLSAAVLGFADLPIEFHLPVSAAGIAEVRRTLARKGLTDQQPFVLVLPGSRWETKNWWPEHFCQTIDLVQERLGWPVVLAGSVAEENLCQLIAQSCKFPPIELASETGLKDLVSLIAEAQLVLGNDSAPLHIATALKKPVVCIFGPTSPQRTGPYGQTQTVLQADLSCCPCFFRELKQCPNQHECMKRITPVQVTSAIAARIGDQPRSVVEAKS